MPDQLPSYPRLDHDGYARTRAADDFWGQIRRTVNGKPVTEEQIAMIVDSINKGLAPKPGDVLLDLACGNGALSNRMTDAYAGYLGVDFSEFLISVAKQNFEAPPKILFTVLDAAGYVRREAQPERFTRALCYGSFSYFPAADAAEVLRALFEKFVNIEKVYIGNLPDKDKTAEFYKDRVPGEQELNDPGSQIGIWRTRDEFAKLAGDAGWQVQFMPMPDAFFAAHYRYDVLLTRPHAQP